MNRKKSPWVWVATSILMTYNILIALEIIKF